MSKIPEAVADPRNRARRVIRQLLVRVVIPVACAVVLLGVTYGVIGIVNAAKSCDARHEREMEQRERAFRERRRAKHAEAKERSETLARGLGEVTALSCIEARQRGWAPYLIMECSATLADGRIVVTVCEMGTAPGCRIIRVGREIDVPFPTVPEVEP